MVTVWKVFYDLWVDDISSTNQAQYGECSGQCADECVAQCEADPSCVGLQMYSDGGSQCYKLTDAHITNINYGKLPMTQREAATLTHPRPSGWLDPGPAVPDLSARAVLWRRL